MLVGKSPTTNCYSCTFTLWTTYLVGHGPDEVPGELDIVFAGVLVADGEADDVLAVERAGDHVKFARVVDVL